MEHAPSFEIDRGDCEVEGSGVANQASIARTGQAMDVLEQRKQRLDRGAGMRDQLIAACRPWPRLTPPMAAMGNAITNAERPEPLPACVTVILLVAIDSVLGSADELVGRHRLIDVARREDSPPHDAAALVHRDMRLVAEEVLALLLRPRRIRIKRAPHQLAGRAAIGVRRQGSGRRSRRIDRRPYQRGIDQRAALQDKARALNLAGDQRKGALRQLAFGQLFAKPPQRRMVGHVIRERKPEKMPERQPIGQGFLELRVGKTVQLLEQQRLEKGQRRIGRRPHRTAAQASQQALNILPIDQLTDPLQGRIRPSRVRYQIVRKAQLTDPTLCHGRLPNESARQGNHQSIILQSPRLPGNDDGWVYSAPPLWAATPRALTTTLMASSMRSLA